MESWLRPRLQQAPESLRSRILEAVGNTTPNSTLPDKDEEGLASLLQHIAEGLLEIAKAGAPTRETAVTLLAADALITFSCEAEAEVGVHKLEDLR